MSSARTLAVLVAVLALGASRGEAQLRPDEGEAAAALEAYRDGERRVRVERHEHDAFGQRVTLDDGRARFTAWVTGDALLRRHDHRAVTPAELAALGLTATRSLAPSIGLVMVRSAGEDGLDIAARLADRRELEVVPDLRLLRSTSAIDVPPDDPRYSGQRYLSRIEIESAWAISTGDPASTIAVLDTGCDAAHPDLSLLPGYDVVSDDDDPSPPASTAGNAHGTECAGIVAAIGDNAEGIAGTCPECTVRCVRLLPGNEEPIAISSDVAAFQHAIDWNVVAVSNSWGFREEIPVPGPLRDIMIATQTMGRGGLGAVVVFAAGNESRVIQDFELYAVEGVLTVGGINIFDEAVQYTNSGAAIDVSAPLGTLTTDISGPDGDEPGDYTSTFGGTSSACPVVSGIIGLLASAYPEATATELHDAVIRTVRPARFATPDENGHDLLYGYGIVDPTAALLSLGPPLPDAGVAEDAGSAADAGAPSPTAGCGCRATAHEGSLAVPGLLALVLIVRRRR